MPNCLKCGSSFKPSFHSLGKFCSRGCSSSYWNHKQPKRKRTARLYNCANCNKFLKKESQRKYCSQECQIVFNRQKTIKKFNRGGDCSDKTGRLSRVIRNYLIKDICGNKCSRCGWSEENPYIKKVILTIEHKDGNAHNNTRGNISVLCYNCHSLTPTFGILNKGNGVRYTAGMREVDMQNLKNWAHSASG